jgi:hypothetical protein
MHFRLQPLRKVFRLGTQTVEAMGDAVPPTGPRGRLR